ASGSNRFLITAAGTPPAPPAASPATSGWNRGRRLSKVHRAPEWLKPSFARSSATMSASVRDQMPKPSCVSCQLGSPTTTRFTRTRLSDIVHPVSSSQLTQDPDRVRSFGGYNSPCGTLSCELRNQRDTSTYDSSVVFGFEVPIRVRCKCTSVPIPKFASPCGTLRGELRKVAPPNAIPVSSQKAARAP